MDLCNSNICLLNSSNSLYGGTEYANYPYLPTINILDELKKYNIPYEKVFFTNPMICRND